MQQNLDIPVFYGTFADLSRFDLSFLNGKIVRYKGIKFKNCIKSLITPELFPSTYSEVISETTNHTPYEAKLIHRFAIVPLDISKPFLEENWYHFFQLILSIYPSDFTLIEEIHLRPGEAKYRSFGKTFYSFKNTGEKYFDNFMFIDKPEYNFVRKYLANYFHTSKSLKYIKYILTLYTNSFSERSPIYQYLSLIICLEVIVEGKEQLTYRLKRNTALLCGEKLSHCETIFRNVDQLYKLRSAIVHGDIKPTYKNFKEYHDYLRKLVAKLIRQLIMHNISSIQEINEKLTTLGYGQNRLISSNWRSTKYPLFDTIDLSYKSIQKY